MPAITLAWPEAGWFGYDRILAAKDLGYRGLPFNWVTMPDQFTLASLERQLLTPPRARRSSPRSPSSPRTPPGPRSRRCCPGTRSATARSSTAYATAGDPPEVVWRDPDRVRAQYRRSARLRAPHRRGFAARRAARPPLLVVLGDHQPAAFVSGDPAAATSRSTSSAPRALLARLDGWGWTPGLIPGARRPGLADGRLPRPLPRRLRRRPAD